MSLAESCVENSLLLAVVVVEELLLKGRVLSNQSFASSEESFQEMTVVVDMRYNLSCSNRGRGRFGSQSRRSLEQKR